MKDWSDLNQLTLSGEMGETFDVAKRLADPTDYHAPLLAHVAMIADARDKYRPLNYDHLVDEITRTFGMMAVWHSSRLPAIAKSVWESIDVKSEILLSGRQLPTFEFVPKTTPGYFTDPTGRNALREWNGWAWTDNVKRRPRQRNPGQDPIDR